MIQPLTSLRFFFAFLVFLTHLPFLSQHEIFSEILSEGFIGVSFFFILSGFILSYNYHHKIKERKISLKQFYVARIARIYPMHVFSLLCILPLSYGTPGNTALTNLLLLQSYTSNRSIFFSLNAPSWSISNEMFFYLLFPFATIVYSRLSRILKLSIASTAVILVIYINLYFPDGKKHYWLYIAPYIRMIDFCIGITLFHVTKHISPLYNKINKKNAAEVLVILFFIFTFLLHWRLQIHWRYSIFYWPAMASVILIFALSNTPSSEGGIISKFLSYKPLTYLGEISFSFYMLHYPIIHYGDLFLKNYMEASTVHIKILFIFLVTLISSIFAFEIIEKPFNRKIKQIFK